MIGPRGAVMTHHIMAAHASRSAATEQRRIHQRDDRAVGARRRPQAYSIVNAARRDAVVFVSRSVRTQQLRFLRHLCLRGSGAVTGEHDRHRKRRESHQ